MDPFSAATSGIGVVSLAIQLLDSIQKITIFIRSVSQAPKELLRLLALLDQLHCLLDGIKTILQRLRQMDKDKDIDKSETIAITLQGCEVQIKELSHIIFAAKNMDRKNQALNRTISSLYLVSKKKDVQDIEEALHRAVTILQAAMTVNIMELSISNSKLLQLQETEVAPIPSDPPSYEYAVQRTKSNHKIKTILGSTVSQTTYTRHTSAMKLSTSDDDVKSKRVFFVPPFLSFSLEINYRSSFGSISRNLRTIPVISKSAPVFKLCARGDVDSLKSLFSQRAVSPYSMARDGWTLLHQAAFHSQPDVCRLLLDLGTDRYQTIQSGFTPLERVARFGSARRESPGTVPTIRALLSGSVNELHLSDLPGFFRHYFGPPAGIKLLLDQEVVGVDLGDIQGSATEALLGSLNKYGSTRDPEWKPILSRLIRLGADIHHQITPYSKNQFGWHVPMTPLNMLMEWFHDPFDAKSFLDGWLTILAEAGWDIHHYINTESELRATYALPVYSSHGPRFHARQFKFSTDPPSIWFEWWTDPLSPAAEVLEEFKNFGPWRFEGDDVDGLIEDLWPCGQRWWDFPGQGGFTIYPRNQEPEFKRRMKLIDERFERREQRKLVKYYKGLGFRDRTQMPGAWRD